MRLVLIAIMSIMVVGIVLFVVFNEPVPSKPDIEVARIDITRQPQPVLPNDPAADHILDFFPDPKDIVPTQPSEEVIQPILERPTPSNKPKYSREEYDLNRLLAMISDWVYTNFSQVGDNKFGQIHKTREKEYVDIHEGKKLENEIQIARLTEDAVTLALGEAQFNLRLAQKPEFFDELKDKWRPLTPEEQQQAYEYYMRRYGDKFKTASQGYKHPAGLPLPKPVSQQQQQEGMQEYMKMYGNRFAKEAETYKQPFPGTEKQRENFKKYWERYHPGLPAPDFDKTFASQAQLGPANRVQTENSEQD